jgi:hypothetical protein
MRNLRLINLTDEDIFLGDLIGEMKEININGFEASECRILRDMLYIFSSGKNFKFYAGQIYQYNRCFSPVIIYTQHKIILRWE